MANGTWSLHIPSIQIMLDIVDVDIPALIDHYVLDGSFLMVDSISNRLCHRIVHSNNPLRIFEKWWIPLIRDQHRLYVHLHVPTSAFYNTKQLLKLHQQVAHPSPVNLYNLLKKAGTKAVDSNTLHQLEKIVTQCDPSQRIKNALYRVLLTFG